MDKKTFSILHNLYLAKKGSQTNRGKSQLNIRRTELRFLPIQANEVNQSWTFSYQVLQKYIEIQLLHFSKVFGLEDSTDQKLRNLKQPQKKTENGPKLKVQ